MAALSQTTFSNAFYLMKICEFCLRFLWISFIKVGLEYSSIGSDNGLAPTVRQAIIWTNADPVHWRIYAAQGEMS